MQQKRNHDKSVLMQLLCFDIKEKVIGLCTLLHKHAKMRLWLTSAGKENKSNRTKSTNMMYNVLMAIAVKKNLQDDLLQNLLGGSNKIECIWKNNEMHLVRNHTLPRHVLYFCGNLALFKDICKDLSILHLFFPLNQTKRQPKSFTSKLILL